MKIKVEDARKYWMHHSQHSMGFSGKDLPDWGEYWAEGGVCIMTHVAFWPGIIEAHLGVLPGAWGKTTEPVRQLLGEIWRTERPKRIIAHVEESNRPTAALLRRVGAVIDGKTPIPGASVIQYGWSE